MTELSPFEYLWEAARKYGGLGLVHEFEAFISQITERQLTELAGVYCEIARREDSEPISRWMDRPSSWWARAAA